MYNEAPALEVADKYLTGIKKSGPENILAICPFHTKADGRPERTPSFAMSLTTGLWVCHSCKERGNFRMFLKAQGISRQQFDTTYKDLLAELDSSTAGKKRKSYITVDEAELDEACLGLFQYRPEQMVEWGFTDETLLRFDVGFDQKNNRITFPLRNLYGKLVGISGRSTDGRDPRYKIYSKEEYEAWGIRPPNGTERGELIWNFDKVYPTAFFEHGTEVVIAEGFKGCMWIHQAGIAEVVAMIGSSMSHVQQMMFERLGGPFYLFLDNDFAGERAKAYLGKQLAKSSTVRVVEYEGNQPTDLSPESVLLALETAQDFNQWALRKRIEHVR